MRKLKYLIILALIIIILVLVDISLRIWYGNNLNLRFNSTEFNNILTPILTLIATPIYAWALYTTINQNKIALSQNLKPFYEKEIDNFLIKGKKIKFKDSTLFNKEKINALNYVEYIAKCLVNISLNEQYKEDYDKYIDGQKFNRQYFLNRNYINELMFLTNFTIGVGEIFFFYSEINEFIDKINNSKLIDDDKELLKTRIYNEILSQYISLIELDIKHNFQPKIPDIYPTKKLSEIEFKKISETGFSVNYKTLIKKFKDK